MVSAQTKTTPSELRTAARAGAFSGLTIGQAPGFVQVNLVVLPARDANDFVAFCRANEAACPVLAVSEPGDPHWPALGDNLDLRSDCPAYWIHRNGRHAETVADIRDYWRNDLVGVALGCWLSMEDALLRAGVRLRHLELGIQGPLMRTNRPTVSVGMFSGPLVVSMRPFAAGEVATVKAVDGTFPALARSANPRGRPGDPRHFRF